MKYFRTIQGEIVNAVQHTLEQLEKYPNLQVYIGTDSQSYSKDTVYVTAIVYRYNTRGCHYIFHKEKVNRVKSDYHRLYDEGVRTIETFSDLTKEIPIQVEALEFDYNEVLKNISNKLVSDFRGWVSGLPTRGVFKSGKMIACKAADHIIRH